MSARHLRFVATPLTLILFFAHFLISDQRLSDPLAASGAGRSEAPLSLTGEAAVDHLKSEGIYAQLMRTIEADSYRITTSSEEAEDGSSGTFFSAVNSAQHLRAEFSRDGIRLSPLPKSALSELPQKSARREALEMYRQLGSRQKSARREWQMSMSLLGYGYGEATREVAARLTHTDGNRIETTYVARSNERPAISEWHINGREGIEHGFTITDRPGVNLTGAPLRVRMKVEGDLVAQVADGGGAVVFARKDGQGALKYDHLEVEDALGRKLDAWMEASGGEVAIVVDEAAAVYPLTIDPLISELKRLADPNGVTFDQLGMSVSLTYDTVVVGAPGVDSNRGAAYIFERDQGGTDEWVLATRLIAFNRAENEFFGASVDISNDTVVVGAPLGNEAYVFERDSSGDWVFTKWLIGGSGSYGSSVAIDRDRIVVGAPFDDLGTGGAFIYERDNGWEITKVLTGNGDYFGASVDISSDTIVVGAPDAPASYIFDLNKEDENGDPWGLVKKLPMPDGSTFGDSVAIHHDTVVIGDYGVNTAHIYERNEGGKDKWGIVKVLSESDQYGDSVAISNDRIIVGAPAGNAAFIYARNQGGVNNWGQIEMVTGPGGGLFGGSVAISSDTIVIGAFSENDDKGAAYVFSIECDEWVPRGRKTDSEAAVDDEALFGISVAVSDDTAVVGARSADGGKGAAYIYERNKGGTNQWGLVKKLPAPGGMVNDDFGKSVAIDSDRIVVGASGEVSGRGAVYIFERDDGGTDEWVQVKRLYTPGQDLEVNGELQFPRFGSSVAINNETVIVGASGLLNFQGAAYIFERDMEDVGGDPWGLVAKLSDPNGEQEAAFGESVSISSRTAVVGAPFANFNSGAVCIFERDEGGANQWGLGKRLTAEGGRFGTAVGISFDTLVVGTRDFEAVYIYERHEGGRNFWGMVDKLTSPDAGSIAGFGSSVSIRFDTVVIGAPDIDSGKGAAYIFARDKQGEDNWGLVKKLIASDGASGNNFGYSVALGYDTVIVGAPGVLQLNGAAYIFARDCDSSPACAELPEDLPPGKAGVPYDASVASSTPGEYTYSLQDSVLPEGFDLDPQTGKITGLSNTALQHPFTIKAERADGCIVNQFYVLVIECPEIVLEPMELPKAKAGMEYSVMLSTMPAGDYSYGLIDSMLPEGLDLDEQTGVISGTPVTPGFYGFTIRAERPDGCSVTQPYTLEIECSDITLGPMNLPAGTVGTEYSTMLSVMPSGSYTYSLIDSMLPEGLDLDEQTGVISGTPNASGAFTFKIRAQNQAGCNATQDFTLVIGCASLLAPMSLPGGTAGVAYSASIAPTPPGNFSYSVISGVLPPGYSLNPTTGVISGLTQTMGSFTFTARAQNQNGCSTTQSYTLEIGCPEINLNLPTLPDGTIGVSYTATLVPSPAISGYTFAVTSGSLPNGLSLNTTTGKIAGSPTKNGEFNFTITVTGFGTCSKPFNYTIIIGSPACQPVPFVELPEGKVGKIYNKSVTTAPAGAYSFSVSPGLPPGVNFYSAIGLLFGYPTQPGEYDFTITATNSSGCSENKVYTLKVSN